VIKSFDYRISHYPCKNAKTFADIIKGRIWLSKSIEEEEDEDEIERLNLLLQEP
jgi:hypothetical protein